MAKYPKHEVAEALERLKQWLPPGKTVFCIVRQTSRSGMSRNIQLIYFNVNDNGEAEDRHPTYTAAKVLQVACHQSNGHDTIRVNGCGMDMCEHLVNDQLSYAMYGQPNQFKVRRL